MFKVWDNNIWEAFEGTKVVPVKCAQGVHTASCYYENNQMGASPAQEHSRGCTQV